VVSTQSPVQIPLTFSTGIRDKPLGAVTACHIGMFKLLSQESVSETPGRAALGVSCTIHFCALIALTWFSVFNVSTVRFELVTVHAGSEEPARKPQPLYAPARSSPHTVSDHAEPGSTVSVTPRQIESQDSVTPTAIPSEVLALREIKTASEPVVGVALTPTRTIPSLMLAEASLPPPEPPPGEPDIKPPPVIGGRLEPAVLIKQTLPAYPAMARTARVTGVVVLEGTVNVNGSIENIHVVDGHPLLVDEAIKAVKKWKYRPAILNGQPTPSPVTVTVRFTLKYPGQ
jgi:periplasmic protein TonB